MLLAFLERLREELALRCADIALLATFGSRLVGANSGKSDLDVLIILDADMNNRSVDEGRYLRVLDVVRGVQDEFGDTIITIPTIGLEEHAVYLGIKRSSRHLDLVHLLLYPTSACLLDWESAPVVKGMCGSAEVLFGNRALLDELTRVAAPAVTFGRIFSDCLRDLIKGHVYVQCANIPEELLKDYGVHVLKYSLRYVSAAALGELGCDERALKTWRGVVEQAKAREAPFHSILQEVDAIDAGVSYADVPYIQSLFKRAIAHLELIRRSHLTKERRSQRTGDGP